MSLVAGLISCVCLALGCGTTAALIFWLLNRILDGLDGAVARKTGTSSDFGGLLDLYVDFVIYCLLPISRAYSTGSAAFQLVVQLLLAAITVNGVSWMILSAILEKRANASTSTGAGAASKRITTVQMPPALIEGAETIVFYTLMIVASHPWDMYLMALFAVLVFCSSLQHMTFACRVLQPPA